MSSEYDDDSDLRLGRLVRLRDPRAVTRGTTRWFDGVTTAIDEERSDDGRRRRLSRKYYVCLGAFTSSHEAMEHFCELESRGRVVPCLTDPVDLEAMEQSGDVMYVDDLPHPALTPIWSTRRRVPANLRDMVARRHCEEQDGRRLQVVAAVVDGLRSSPFYSVLPNARSRHILDEMCLRAMAPIRQQQPRPHRLAVLPSGDIDVDPAVVDVRDEISVSMRNIAEASKVYEADVAMFLCELAFVKIWACETHGSVQTAREARMEKKESRSGVTDVAWIREATALSRFDRGVRDAIRNCLLHD